MDMSKWQAILLFNPPKTNTNKQTNKIKCKEKKLLRLNSSDSPFSF